MHSRGCHAKFHCHSGQSAGCLADVPLDGVQPEAAVGDVGGANILSPSNEITNPLGQQCAKRDLERPGATACAYVVGSGSMDVDGIPAHAHRVAEKRSARSRLVVGRDFLLDYGL